MVRNFFFTSCFLGYSKTNHHNYSLFMIFGSLPFLQLCSWVGMGSSPLEYPGHLIDPGGADSVFVWRRHPAPPFISVIGDL
jgi:hypothetical protein